MKIQY